MKRGIFLILSLGGWFILGIASAQDDAPKPPSLEQEKREYTERLRSNLLMEQKAHPIWYTPEGKAIIRRDVQFQRPAGVDEDGWNDVQIMFGLVLEENQPIEFYAHIVDENEKPVEGAQMEFAMSGFNTQQLLEKFPHISPEDAQTNWTKIITSDAKGWIQLKGVAGHYLTIHKLSKDGYSSLNNLGVIEYTTRIESATQSEFEAQYKQMTNGVPQSPHARIISGSVDTNVINPNKGFTFILKKA